MNKIEKVHPSQLRNGDTVLLHGNMVTVSRRDIKHCPFLGWQFYGKRVDELERVLFRKWFRGEVVDWVPQI